MKIFVIIVTYNGGKWLDKCLGSLRSSTLAVTPIVIDNASTDGSVEYIRTHFPEVQILPNSKNLGFAKANNIGIRYALEEGADYIFLLNQDAWVEQNTIEELIHTFVDNQNVGIASPVHLNGSYTGLDFNFHLYMGAKFISDTYMHTTQHYYSVDFVNAAAWMISAECLRKVGGFDTLLFKHYGEDNNLAQRVKYHGYGIVINTHCTICHDREYRANSFDTSKFNPNQSEHFTKLGKGNIQVPFDANLAITNLNKELLRAYIGFHPKKVLRIKEEIALIKLIRQSREHNMRGGLVWLDDHSLS